MNNRTDTGIVDKNYNHIFVEDEVSLFGMVGEVCYESGAYGVGFENTIDWDLIESRIPEVTGCNNSLYACKNDNFISFWELLWNFNCEEDVCVVVEVIYG